MTPKESSEALGQRVKFRGHEYQLTALIKRHTPKGVIWQVELSKGNGVIIADPKEVNINDRIK